MPGEIEPSSDLACVTVTYRPDVAILARQLRALPADALKIIVDNGSGAQTQQELAERVAGFPNALFLPQTDNLGLAAAINLAVRALAGQQEKPSLILLLDQDSEPQAGSVTRLCQALLELEQQGRNPGAVGPQLRDAQTGLHHGFHIMRRWRWLRVYPDPASTHPVEVANLNGSGTVMRRSVFERLNGLDESFFIDHVDTEWSFRLRAAGYRLYGIADAVFIHRMGERSLRFWLFGWRLWPARSAARHFYLFRNAVWLMRRDEVPRVWKFWAVIKLALTVLVHGMFDPDRRAQLAAMVGGVREGISTSPRLCG